MMRQRVVWTAVLAVMLTGYACASDWTGFRGPGALGISDETGLAVTWSETENLAWKTELPGAGSSSPIVLGDKVFVTCYSGYGLDKDNPGDINNLKRHLLCISATDGQVIWDKTVPATLPEDPYKGMFREHGYASQTPVTDGRNIYVFFGKSGALAFDTEGSQLWQTPLGSGSDEKHWGSATSPVVHKNMVIINAWDESKTLYALNKRTGKEIWKKDLSETGLTFSTPVLTKGAGGRSEMVLSLPAQVWGLDPDTGGQLWIARTDVNDLMIPTPVITDGVAYIHGGGTSERGSLAVRTGGDGDVTKTHIMWAAEELTSGPSPVVLGDLMYWVDGGGNACCVEAKTGKVLYNEKLPVTGRFAVYASPVLADGRIYAVTRKSGTFVLAAGPKFKIIAHNKLPSDETDFNASPAVSNRRMFMRSDKCLYCIRKAD